MISDGINLDVVLLAALVAAEARGESYEGQVAVACVARNRVDHSRWWGRTWREVILAPMQFTPFNAGPLDTGEQVRDRLLELFALIEPQHTYIALGVYHRRIADNTNGATHFVNRRIAPFPPGVLARPVIAGIAGFMRWEDRRLDVLPA